MKKILFLSSMTLALMTVSCKEKEEAAETAVPVETAVEQMTEAIADTNAVAPAADTAAAK